MRTLDVDEGVRLGGVVRCCGWLKVDSCMVQQSYNVYVDVVEASVLQYETLQLCFGVSLNLRDLTRDARLCPVSDLLAQPVPHELGCHQCLCRVARMEG